MEDVFVYDHVRTPIGKFGGALADTRPDDLAAHVVRALVARAPSLDPARIDDVYYGDANAAGEDNRDVARMAVLLAGLPTSVPGATINRLCGSGLEAVIAASRAVQVGDASLILAGGVESMSRAPWVLRKPARGYPAGHEQLWSTTLGWRMTNPEMPAEWTQTLGECTELLADKFGISRQEQDVFAHGSHQRAAAAWAAGVYTNGERPEVVGLPGVELARDEGIRETTTLDTFGTLKPAFREHGTITAGNASPLSDGAAALFIGDAAAGQILGLEPLARVVSRGVAGVEPQYFGIGPVEAAYRSLARAGVGFGDLARVELNEAFAAQSLACLAEWPELDPSIVNVDGGAIALGHPLGCSGARIVGHLARQLHELARAGGNGGGPGAAGAAPRGLAAICIGVGQGLALVLEGV